ncbi:MAG: glycosyltransferase family 2 protein [Actinomycetota bacterium]|nr:glycosyltransferase family 2 protein [Actinomycetota bacterium]
MWLDGRHLVPSPRTASDVDVILPVLDEAGAIPWVLERMPAGYRPIVVDNGSRDGSGDLARRMGARVVDEAQKGFGAACAAGLAAATADIVCFMDCDRSLDPQELAAVVDPLRAGDADLVLGARRPEPGAWPRHSRMTNRILVELLRRRTGVKLRDLGPMRAARRDELLGLEVSDRRFGWPLEMVVLAAGAGMRVSEVEVSYLPRTGRSKVTGTVRGTARTVLDMSKAMR